MEARILSVLFNAVSPTLKIVLGIWEELYKYLLTGEVNILPLLKLQQQYTQKSSFFLSRKCSGSAVSNSFLSTPCSPKLLGLITNPVLYIVFKITEP